MIRLILSLTDCNPQRLLVTQSALLIEAILEGR
jgi:hypothetical protein